MKLKTFKLPITVLSLGMLLASCGQTQAASSTPASVPGSSADAPTSSVAPETSSKETPEISSEAPVSEVSTPISIEQPKEKFTVTFNSKGGTAVRKQTVVDGELATEPADPNKAGYVFLGWYTDEALTQEFDFATPITGNITLYAGWEVNLERVLTSSITPNIVDGGDSELTLWTETSGFLGHNKTGKWASGNSITMSWRTVLVVDSEGRVCFSVWCPDNGYGNPKDYSYVCDEHYSSRGVGYQGNPAFRLGPTYPTNPDDFELIVPEGGFALTGHTAGATSISQIVTNGAINLYDGSEDDGDKRSYNATHGEWSTRRYKYDGVKGALEVYDLATYISYTGSASGVFEGDNEAKTYSEDIALTPGASVTLNHFDGLLSSALTAANTTITGEFTSTLGGDGDQKMYFVDGSNAFHAGRSGTYSFVYDLAENTLDISFAAEVEIDPDAVISCAINAVSDTYATIYDSNAESIVIGAKNYTLGVDATGKVIYASYGPGNGYGGPGDGFYHDGNYGATAGQVCGIFDLDAEFAPWPATTGDGRNAWTLYDIVVPEGGYIITGALDQIKPLVQEWSGFDMSGYENNVLFENTLQDGDYNGKQLVFDVKTNYVNITLASPKYTIDLVDVIGTVENNSIVVQYGDEYTLPTPVAPAGYTFSRWVNGNGQTVESGTFQADGNLTFFAAYIKDGVEVAYSGKEKILSTSADSTFSVFTGSDVVVHSVDGWNVGCTINFSWRTFAIIDDVGRVAYAVWCPANGYGGPKAYSYHCDPYYSASGVGWENNPCIEILPDWDEWPNKTASGKNAWDQFTITLPTGWFLVSSYDAGDNALVSMISGGEMARGVADFNKPHAWSNRMSQDGEYVYTKIALPE